MKALLVMPPFERLMGMRFSYFPIGLGYLASVLKAAGVETRIYNAENPPAQEALSDGGASVAYSGYDSYALALGNEEHPVWKEVTAVLRDFKPDLVGISVTSAKVGAARKISRLVKDCAPGTRVVWGGAHPTILPEEVLRFGEVDFVIRGEGEQTIVELVNLLKAGGTDFEGITGVSYKTADGVIHGRPRLLTDDLDSLPLPAKDCIVFPERLKPWDLGVVITSRGCPFDCSFCAAQTIWGRQVRFRTIDNVMGEIDRAVRENGAKNIFFWDDSFTIDRQRVVELCRRLIASGKGINWRCTARLDGVDPGMLALMRKAGCSSMDVGIESGSDRILALLNKHLDRKIIARGLKMIEDSGINANAFFMAGFPDETKEDIEETFNLMKKHAGGTIIFSVFTPYPGTQQYRRALELGLIPEKVDWDKFSHHSPHNHFVKNIRQDEFRAIIARMSAFADRHNRSAGIFLRVHRKEIGFYLKNPSIFFAKAANKLSNDSR